MKKYGKSIFIAMTLLLCFDIQSKEAVMLGAKLHKIIPHVPTMIPSAHKSLCQLRNESADAIKKMSKSLKGIQDLEVKYKTLLTKDAKQTLTEFKDMLNLSIASHTALLNGIEQYLKSMKDTVSQLDERSQELFAHLF